MFKASGTSPFFYHVPHDHNFSFLTVGYLGPGYWSEYYEYDYESVVGLPGEKVDLRFVEKAKLDPGKVMLYRAHKDVHNQLPADEMSVSINIMEASPKLPFLAQYRFDPAKCEIAGVLTRSSSEALLALAANHDGGNARDLVESFARHHPCERLQFAALRELAAARSGHRRRPRDPRARHAPRPTASSPAWPRTKWRGSRPRGAGSSSARKPLAPFEPARPPFPELCPRAASPA